LLEEPSEPLVDHGLHNASISEFNFPCLAFELRLRQLDADHRHKAFADVVSSEISFTSLNKPICCPAELMVRSARCGSGEMRASVDVLMLLAKLKTIPSKRVILQADFDVHVIFVGFHVDGLVVQNGLAAIEVLDEFDDAAGVLELGPLASPVLESVWRSSVSVMTGLYLEMQFAQALRKRIEVCIRGGEIVLSGMKWTRVRASCCSRFLEFTGGLALGVSLLPGETVAPDFQIEFFTERVHAAHADAVQAPETCRSCCRTCRRRAAWS